MANRQSTAPKYWTVEKAGFALTMTLMIFSVGAGWATLNSKVERLTERLDGLADGTRNDRCVQIISRQIHAIEQSNARVQSQLAQLSSAQGCLVRQDVEAHGASGPLTTGGSEQARIEAERDRLAFRAALTDADRQLGLNRPDP